MRPTTKGNETAHGIVVVGAGVAGIGVGIELRKAGFTDFVILERADDVGGTWRDHRYPGLTVDAPSLIYSFSYAPKPDWSSVWAPRDEVLDYCRDITDEFGVRPHLRFGAAVESADYDADRNAWVIRTGAGATYVCRYLINGSGYLNVPKTPDIPGLESFGGEQIHSCEWSDETDLAGRSVALVGTGATTIQLAPALAGSVSRLHIFQRTPIWCLPKPPLRFPAAVQRIFAHVPGAQRLARLLILGFMDLVFFRAFTNYPQVARLARGAERLCRWHIRKQVRDPATRKELTPEYNWGCKRPSFSNDFYPIFNRDDVDLVTQPIAEVTEDSAVTTDGVRRQVDAIVLATGYQPFEKAALPTYPVRGQDGLVLQDFWDLHRYQAYRGFAVPGFPNFFMVFGPYSIASSSYFVMVELAARNIVRCLSTAQERRADYVEVTAAANARDHEDVLRRKATSIWATANCAGSNTYYLDRFGDTPGFRPSYHHVERWASRTLPMEDFHIERKESHRASA